MNLSSLFRLVLTVGGTFLAAAGGSLITAPNIESWYELINKPSWTPPSFLFGPVWSILYLFMAIAAFLVWQKGCHRKLVQVGLTIYALQLGLNFLWSVLFFGFHALGFASAEILILLAFIIGTIVVFWHSSKTAALLLVPYALWVSFASALTIAIWQLNP